MAKFEGAYYFADVLQIKGSKVMVYYHDDGLVATVGIADIKPTSVYHHCLSRCTCSCLFVLATTITVTSGWVPLVRSFWMMTANSGLCANQFRRKVTTCAGNKMQIRILKTISIAGMSYGWLKGGCFDWIDSFRVKVLVGGAVPCYSDVGLSRFLCLYLDLSRSFWIYLKLCGFIWFFVDLCRFILSCVDLS